MEAFSQQIMSKRVKTANPSKLPSSAKNGSNSVNDRLRRDTLVLISIFAVLQACFAVLRTTALVLNTTILVLSTANKGKRTRDSLQRTTKNLSIH
jgi:hypothetical protein